MFTAPPPGTPCRITTATADWAARVLARTPDGLRVAWIGPPPGVGTTVALEWPTPAGPAVAPARVVAVDADHVTLRFRLAPLPLERRRDPRWAGPLPARIGPAALATWPATLDDVSVGGARLVTAWTPDPGTPCRVAFTLAGTAFDLPGTVVWVAPARPGTCRLGCAWALVPDAAARLADALARWAIPTPAPL